MSDPFLVESIEVAKQLASHWNTRIYIIKSRIYADEHSDSPYVVGGKVACLVMYPKRKWMKDEDWNLTGCVDPDGSVFLTGLEDILKLLTA